VILYRKFSDILQREFRTPTTPKPPKAPKAHVGEARGAHTLGGLGALGDLATEPREPAKPFSLAQRAAAIWGEVEEERAAIIEYDGGVPRAWAEALARLDPNRPPVGVLPKYWLRFINACGRFVDGGWHQKAAALGWGPLELFGCSRDHPFRDVDRMGLLWRIGDYEVEALTRDTACVTTPGGMLYARRRPTAPGSVLAWEVCEKQNDQ
jgi:hypothetical protein